MAEQAHITSIKEALITLRMAAAETEAVLPAAVTTHKWIAKQHSPNPWEDTYAHYCNEECDASMLMALAIRKNLAEVIALLDWCIVQSEADGTPIGSLALARTRRTA